MKSARMAAGMNLRDLAQAARVSAMALSKYERGLMRPSPKVRAALAKALRVSPDYFTEDATLELENVEYRASSRMTAVSKRLINAEIRRQLELRRRIEALVPELAIPFALPEGSRIARFEQIEQVAEQIREVWGLGAQPIGNLTNLFETHGIAALHLSIRAVRDEWFDGLSCWVGEQPVVVVGRDWPGDRQRFTLAHELGHLMLHGRIAAELDEERACHRFAGAFLAPKSAVKALFVGDEVAPLELWFLKHEWGLSMGAWIYRLRDVGKIREETARKLWREFRVNAWGKKEPGPPLARETATWWKRQVCSLVVNRRITNAIAAQLLDVEVDEVGSLVAMGPVAER